MDEENDDQKITSQELIEVMELLINEQKEEKEEIID